MYWNFEIPIKAYNSYYRIYRNRYCISHQGQQFRENIKEYFNRFDKFKFDKPISISFEFYFKDNRKRDLDNMMKAIIDSCKDILFVDDSLIYELKAIKKLGSSNDKIIINIQEIIL